MTDSDDLTFSTIAAIAGFYQAQIFPLPEEF